MKLLKIYRYPDLSLLKPSVNARPEKNLKELQQLIDLMFHTMKFYEAVGLAAVQVGVHLNIITIKMPSGESYSMINPEIIDKSQKCVSSLESCLSFPNINGTVKRHKTIHVNYIDYNGNQQTLIANDLLSFIIQHELDHCQGILMIDKVKPLKKELILKKLKKHGRLK